MVANVEDMIGSVLEGSVDTQDFDTDLATDFPADTVVEDASGNAVEGDFDDENERYILLTRKIAHDSYNTKRDLILVTPAVCLGCGFDVVRENAKQLETSDFAMLNPYWQKTVAKGAEKHRAGCVAHAQGKDLSISAAERRAQAQHEEKPLRVG